MTKQKSESELALINKLTRILGPIPEEFLYLLHVLTRTDVIDLTEEYVRAERLQL